MKEMTMEAASKSTAPKKYLIPGLILVVVALLIGFFAYRGAQKSGAPAEPQETTIISQDELEADYGLQVQLVAVTAVGGLVDVRLQIVDAGKAKALLEDQANFPSLLVGDDVVLQVSGDIAEQGIQFENGKSIYVLYPNAQSTVKSGDPVILQFGDLQVEAIPAK